MSGGAGGGTFSEPTAGVPVQRLHRLAWPAARREALPGVTQRHTFDRQG